MVFSCAILPDDAEVNHPMVGSSWFDLWPCGCHKAPRPKNAKSTQDEPEEKGECPPLSSPVLCSSFLYEGFHSFLRILRIHETQSFRKQIILAGLHSIQPGLSG